MPPTDEGVSPCAVLFERPGIHGDFDFMVEQPRYCNTLFLIFENVHDMIFDDEPGGGTAVLRLYCPQHLDGNERPAATGIPTGWTRFSGFTHMDAQVKGAIDNSFERVQTLLMEHEYDRIVYSCDPKKPRLIGSGIFKDSLCDEVIMYISKKIHKIQREHKLRMSLPQGGNRQPCKSLKKLTKFEREWLAPTAKPMIYGGRLRNAMKKRPPWQFKWNPHYDPTHPDADFSDANTTANMKKRANPYEPSPFV